MFGDGATFIASSVSGACTCGRAAHLFISRNGRSQCVLCDGKQLKVAATECVSTDDDSASRDFHNSIV
jgi:Zn finger protein HypA/HybF involved in hydrogenase expression